MKKKLLTMAALVVLAAGAQGQVLINSVGTNVVTENFNSFLGSAITVPTSNGFSVIDTGATAWGYQGTGTGSGNTGGIYAYGSSSADYSFGFLRSSTRAGGLAFDAVNNSGLEISGLTFTFDYEQWRYANASGFTLGGTGALSSVDFSTYGFVGSSTGTNGTPSTSPISIVLTGLSIANSATFGLEWTYADASGADNGIAIDNFTLSATAVPEPTAAMLLGGAGMMLWVLRRKRSVVLS